MEAAEMAMTVRDWGALQDAALSCAKHFDEQARLWVEFAGVMERNGMEERRELYVRRAFGVAAQAQRWRDYAAKATVRMRALQQGRVLP